MAGPVAPRLTPSVPLSMALSAPPIPAASALGLPDIAGAPMIAGAPTDGSMPTIQPLDLPGYGQAAAPKMSLLEASGLGNSNAQLPSVAPDTNPETPLSWVLDMLDRPRRAVGDTVSALWNAGVDAASGKASMGTAVSDIGDVASAPLRGLFSTNAADQQTSGQLIEKGVDKYGKTFDPHYKNTADNVNPILKGALGFAADVATDPLTYVGGPAIRGAVDGGRALLGGAIKTAKDAGPDAVAVAKVADKAAGGDEKAASLIDQMTATGASDAARTAADVAKPTEVPGVPNPITPSAQADVATGTNAPPVPTPEPVVSTKWTPKLEANLKDYNRQLDELQLVDSSRMSREESAVYHAKLDRLTTARDNLVARKYPTGAPAAEATTPAAEASAPVPDTAPAAAPAPKPLSAQLTEPTSVGDQLRASKVAPNFVKAYDKMSAAVAAGAPNMLDAYQNALKSKAMRALFGDNFISAVKNYTNPERFQRMLDETYRIVKEGGHLDDGELETNLSGARNMVRGLLTDAGVAVDKTQTERAAFKAQSAVAATADPVAVVQKMRSTAPRMPTMVKGIQPKDLQDLVKARSDALRDPDPGQDIRTETGAWTDGKGPGKSTAKYTDRMNTHNQAYDVIRASQAGQKQMDVNLEKLGGAARSATLRGIVEGTDGRVGLLDGLTRIRDAWGYSHHIEDGIHAPVAGAAVQFFKLLGSGSAADQRIMDKLLYNGGTPASKTNLLEAIAAAVHGASPEEITAILAKDTKRARLGTQGNFLAKGKATGAIDHTVVKPGTRMPKGYSRVPNPDHPGMFYIRQSADSLLSEAADLITRRADDLRALAKDNKAAYDLRTASEAVEITDAAQKATDLARVTPSMMAEALQGIAEPEKLVESVADVAGGARKDAKALAVEMVKITTPEEVVVDAKAKVAGAAKAAKGDRKGARAEAQKGSDAGAKAAQAEYEKQAAEATAAADAADAGKAAESGQAAPTATTTAVEEEPVDGPTWDADQRTTLGRINRTAKDFDPNATDARIQGRWARTIQGVISFVNKGSNAEVGGLGLEELHTGRLGVERRLSREYGMLGHDFVPYTQQMVGGRSVGSIVLDDALRRVPSAPEYQRARNIVDQMVAHFMGAGVDGTGKMLAEPFLRSGVEPHYVWDILQEKGIIPQDRAYSQEIEDMLLANRHETGSFVGSIADWLVKGDPANGIKPMPINDPNEFLQKMFTATSEFSKHVGIAQDLRDMGLRYGFLSLKGGGSQYRMVGSKGSLFSHVLGDVWAHHETAVAINRVSDMLKPTKQMKAELSTILQAFDDLQQAWKYGETAIRPGTHLHNYMSDHIMTWLAEGAGGYRKAMVNATKILAANQKGGAMSVAEMMDGVMGLTHDAEATAHPDEVLFRGKHGELTNHEANQLISDSGLTASARNIQRTDAENLSAVGKGMEKFYQSPVGRFVDKVNELQENHVRMTHAALLLQKAMDTGYVSTRWGKKVWVLGKDGKIDRDVLKLALGERVRRFHPDPNMLTQFEKDGLRRAMPFYMWNRGAVPAIMEAAYLHPGRVLSFNKLSFNLGIALGVQGNNLADPYPNGAWPGFLQNQMQGPQANINGSLFTANPGIPTWDVANMFTDPNQITGSISPLLAIPTEMVTGKGWESHEPITNWYDALDSQLPGVATIASMTGYSPTNSLVSALTGNGPQKTSLAIQGQQDPIQPTVTGLGYGLGINTQHVNKTSYQMAGVAQQQARLSAIMAGVSPQFGH